VNEFAAFGRLLDAVRPWLGHVVNLLGDPSSRSWQRFFGSARAASRLPSLRSALRGLDAPCALPNDALIGATNLMLWRASVESAPVDELIWQNLPRDATNDHLSVQ